MIICIIGYVVLLFLVLQKQKRKIFVWCEEKTGRQILLQIRLHSDSFGWTDKKKIQEKSSGMSMAAEADERLMRSRSDRH